VHSSQKPELLVMVINHTSVETKKIIIKSTFIIKLINLEITGTPVLFQFQNN